MYYKIYPLPWKTKTQKWDFLCLKGVILCRKVTAASVKNSSVKNVMEKLMTVCVKNVLEI